MSSFCLNKNDKSVQNLISKVGEEQANSMAESINNNTDILLEVDGRVKKSMLYSSIHKSITNPVDAFNKYLNYYSPEYLLTHNWLEDKKGLDSNGEPIYGKNYEYELKSTKLDDKFEFIKNIILKYTSAFKNSPTDPSLKDAVEVLRSIDYSDYDNYKLADGFNVEYIQSRRNIDAIKELFYGENGYANIDMLELVNDKERALEFTKQLLEAISFFKGFVAINKVSKYNHANLTASDIAVNNAIDLIQSFNNDVNQLNKTASDLLTSYFDKLLTSTSSNPEIMLGFRHIFDTQNDESKVQLLLDALADTNHSFVATFVKRYMLLAAVKEKQIERETLKHREIMKALKEKGFSIESILDSTEDGKLITEFNNKYRDKISDYNDRLDDILIKHGKYTKEYYELEKEYINWKFKNILQIHKDVVIQDKIDITDILYKNFEAREAIENLTKEAAPLIKTYKNSFDKYNRRDEDEARLFDIEKRRQELANDWNLDGTLKTGKALEIAKTLQEYNEKLSKHFETYYDQIDDDTFADNLKEALANNDYDWLNKNTVKSIKSDFWDDLEANNTILGNEKKDKEFKDAIKLFRDGNGVVNGNKVPKNIVDSIRKEHEKRYEKYNIEPHEDRIPKGFKRPIKNEVTTDDYKARFENAGYNSKATNKAIKRETAKVTNLLTKYIVDGAVKYENISEKDLTKLNNLLDTISYMSTTYSKDETKIAFEKWFSENHEYITDTKSYEASKAIAELKGPKYLAKWLDANSELQYTDKFRDTVDLLKEKYNLLDPKDKKKTPKLLTLTNINFKAIRNVFNKIESYTDLPVALRLKINKKGRSKYGNASYNLSDIVADHIKAHGGITKLTKKQIVNLKATNKIKAYNDNTHEVSTKKSVNWAHYNMDYSDMFNITAIKRYEDLYKKYAKDENGEFTKWYYDNHTLAQDGKIIPLDIWTDSTPKQAEHYDKNAPKNSIWGYTKLTNDNYIDSEKTKARTWMNSNISNSPSEYYTTTFNSNKASMTEEEFNNWFDDNHVYNPYNNEWEPISIWNEMNASEKYTIDHKAKKHLTESKIKDQYSNESNESNTEQDTYRDSFGFALPRKNSEFYNKNFESIKNNKMYKYIHDDVLKKYTEHYDKETLIDKGFLPIMKDSKVNYFLNAIGFNTFKSTTTSSNDDNIHLFDLPYMNKLTIERKLEYPKKEDFKDEKDYKIAYTETKIKNREIQKKNDEFHTANMSKDYETILDNFIGSSIDNKFKRDFEYEFKLAVEKAKQLEYYKKKGVLGNSKSKIGKANLEKQGIETGEVFNTVSGESANVVEHLEKFMEMIFYNNFEADEGNFTKISRVIQNITSAKGMWFNLPGAINNVTYGTSQTLLETYGSYFYTPKDRLKAEGKFWTSVTHTLANIGRDTSTNLEESIIKYFDILESQDETAITNNKQLNKSILKKLFSTDTAYILQHIGEYYMQTIPLLAMISSHRVVNGNIVSIKDYSFDLRYKSLRQALDSEGIKDLDKFIKDAKDKEKYTDGKSDMIRDFILQGTTEVQKGFLEHLNENTKGYEKTFKNYPTLESLLTLKDGQMSYNNVSEEAILEFKLKVINVNQKLQGIYSKIGAGTMQHYALGRILIQFKKYLRPGWNKRFGTKFGKSFWNEQRGELDKGMYVSTFQFFLKPFIDNIHSGKDIENRDLNSMQIATKAVKNILRDYINYFSNVKLYWNTLNDTDKANVKRNMAELVYLSAVAVLLYGLRKMSDDDDKLKDDKFFAYSLYLVDRLQSETLAYSPAYGWFNEGKKLISDPAASFGTVEALTKLLYTALFESNEEFKNGMYIGENKLKIKSIKMIPIANRFLRYDNIENYAGYYKLYSYN